MMDVVTRWNTVHDMLERFLKQQLAISAALLSSEVRKTEKDLCSLTESDVKTAEDIVSALKPIKEATQYMSTENTPTSRRAIWTRRKLSMHVQPWIQDLKVFPS